MVLAEPPVLGFDNDFSVAKASAQAAISLAQELATQSQSDSAGRPALFLDEDQP